MALEAARRESTTPRRKPVARPGHRKSKLLLTVAALCAMLGGWLALDCGTPATTAGAASQGAGDTSVVPEAVRMLSPMPTTDTLEPIAHPGPGERRPQPITRTRSSR
jgi:hypothetical protein